MTANISFKSGIKKVPVFCNSCQADETEFIAHGVEHEYENTTNDVFTVVRCRLCGLIYLNPRPDVSELDTIYPPNYYAYHLQEASAKGERSGSLLFKARQHVYLSRLRKALSFLPPDSQHRILDVGCADGRALNWYRKASALPVRTYGVDFNEQALEIAAAAGHQVFNGRFEDTLIPDNMFDLVVATHVIEHVADPKAFARKAYDVLKPGGVFLCETPNAASWDARLFARQHWGGYHFPRHWVFYTPKTITDLANLLGFELVKIEFHPAPAFWNWTFHSLMQEFASKHHFSRRVADILFPPVDFQKNNFRNLLAVSCFTGFDILQKSLTKQTSNMSVLLRKPAT